MCGEFWALPWHKVCEFLGNKVIKLLHTSPYQNITLNFRNSSKQIVFFLPASSNWNLMVQWVKQIIATTSK
jgi:hypothetical protein